MEEKVKIQKWGNDFGINIPLFIINELSLKEGNYLKIKDIDNKIIIEPEKTVSFNLSDMLNEITDNNLHNFIDWGKPEGNEIW